MGEGLEIASKNPRGEDGYRVFSIRIKEEIVARLERLVMESGYSRNELIGILLEYGVDKVKVVKKK